MATRFQVMIVKEVPGGPDDVTLSSLRDAVLGNPNLVLEVLRTAFSGGAPATDAPQGGGISGELPLDTPIFKMVDPEQAKLLTPAAAKLTKEDLLDLAGVGTTKKKPEDLNLTVEDLASIQDAFHANIRTPEGLKKASDISCCCCTPCCCCTAVAVINPVRWVA
jgi:hypothetical protein